MNEISEEVIVGSPTAYMDQKIHLTDIHMDDGKWTREQTQVLINMWKENKNVLLSSTASSTQQFKAWKLILKEVNKLTPPKSLQQCKKKFRNIRYICKNALNNNKQVGTKKHYPLFYSDFVEIISDCERAKRGVSDSASLEMIKDRLLDRCSPDHSQNDEQIYLIGHDDRSNTPGDENKIINQPITAKTSQTSKIQCTSTCFLSVEHTSANGDEKEANYLRRAFDESPPGDWCRSSFSDMNEIDRKSELESLGECSTHDRFYESSTHMRGDNCCISSSDQNCQSSKGDSKKMRKILNSSPSDGIQRSRRADMRKLELSSDFYPTMVSTSTLFDVRSISNDNGMSLSSRQMRMEQNDKSPIFTFSDINRHCNKTEDLRTSRSFYSPVYITGRENVATSQSGVSFEERLLNLQERQMELFNSMLQRHEQFLLRLLSQQREAAEAAQERDREFMIKLTELFLLQKS